MLQRSVKRCVHLAALMAGCAAGPVLAQSAPEASTGAVTIDEIIITAQRRSESLQDVPIAVTAVSSQELVDRMVTDVTVLPRLAPGLNLSAPSGTRPQLTIRGVGTNRFDIGSESPVGIFIDEVYNPRFAGMVSNFYDLQQVEVLKGPQGTLFGRNTPAGAINIVTAAPTADLSGHVQASIGTENARRAEAAVSGPLSDTVRFRLAGVYEQTPGYSHDTASGHDNSETSLGLRGKLEFTPTDRLTALVTVDYSSAERDLLFNKPGPGPRFLVRPGAPFTASADPFSEAYSLPGYYERDALSGSLRVDYEFDSVRFTSLTGLRRHELSQEEDFDYSPLDIGVTRIDEESDFFSQEFRFTSTPGGLATFGDRVEWVAGVYLARDDASRLDQFNWGADALFNANHALSPDYVTSNIRVAVDTRSAALFGQAAIRLNDRARLTIGGRYTYDEKVFALSGDSPNPVNPHVPAAYVFDGERDWSSFDPRIILDYRVNPNMMLYGSWSSGYKSGGVQFAAAARPIAEVIYEPENVESIEFGVKSEWFDRRLRANFALFNMDYTDLQVTSIVILSNGSASGVTTNAASSTIRGFEAEFLAAPTAELTLSARYAYLDAVYDEFIQDPITNIDLSGMVMPRAPRKTLAVGAAYDRPLANGWSLLAGVDYAYTGDYELSSNEDPTLRVDSHGLLSARIGFQAANGVRIMLVGDNLTDERYFTYASNQGPARNYGYGAPRTYGLTFSYRY